MRSSGILMPVFSLPSKYGIGTFGKEAYKFIDFLSLAKQKYWQVLPLGPTSFGDSPYQSFCAFAGNPYFIDFDMLIEEGLLEKSDVDNLNTDELKIDYEKLYNTRFDVLKKAYLNFVPDETYFYFIEQNEEWLHDYALFMSLKTKQFGASWDVWEEKYRIHNKEVLDVYYKENKQEVDFWKFVQYTFDYEWKLLKEYASELNIDIIGDIPIYVAYDSSDVWANTKLFDLDKNLKPVNVAGCPPDAFSEDGQLWGNPLYNYSLMKKDNYSWWIKRLKRACELYDVIRIDHFRGFEAYFSIPAKDKNAKGGKWKKGPGFNLFKVINEELPNAKIIAEDLGFLTENVHKLLKKTGYPGMKVLEFAFDPKGDSDYLPHNHIKNCVVYTGTHDNMPLRAWFDELNEEEKHFVREYLKLTDDAKVCDQMVRLALESVADLTIIPLQDYLGLGLDARINTPATSTSNWTYRIKKEYLSNELALYIAFLTKLYRRCKLTIEE